MNFIKKPFASGLKSFKIKYESSDSVLKQRKKYLKNRKKSTFNKIYEAANVPREIPSLIKSTAFGNQYMEPQDANNPRLSSPYEYAKILWPQRNVCVRR